MVKTTVEELLREVAQLPSSDDDGPTAVELGVGEALSLQGVAMPFDMAMGLLVDALLQKGYFPDGSTPTRGGRRYRYVRV